MNFVWMNGHNVYIPHAQAEHTTITDPVFFDNSLSQIETVQPTMVCIYILLNINFFKHKASKARQSLDFKTLKCTQIVRYVL